MNKDDSNTYRMCNLKELTDLQRAYEVRLENPKDIGCVYFPKGGMIACIGRRDSKVTLKEITDNIKRKVKDTNAVNWKDDKLRSIVWRLWILDIPRLKIYKKLCQKAYKDSDEKVCAIEYGKSIDEYKREDISDVIKLIDILIDEKSNK